MATFSVKIPQPSDHAVEAAGQVLALKSSDALARTLAEEILRLQESSKDSEQQLHTLIREIQQRLSQGKVVSEIRLTR